MPGLVQYLSCPPLLAAGVRMSRLALAAALLVTVTALAPAEDWPAWRGPRGDGTVADTVFPLGSSATENVKWKFPIGGSGHSSPVVSKGRVFFASCVEAEKERVLH